MINKELAIKAGLAPAGTDDEGEQEYVGVQADWDKYKESEAQAEEDFINGVTDDSSMPF